MSRVSRIEALLGENLQIEEANIELLHLEVVDESANHRGPADAQSHFKVVLVAQKFSHMTRIDRHRSVNQCLQGEFDSGMHALAIHAYDEQQWQSRFGTAPMSPPCLGKSLGKSFGKSLGSSIANSVPVPKS